MNIDHAQAVRTANGCTHLSGEPGNIARAYLDIARQIINAQEALTQQDKQVAAERRKNGPECPVCDMPMYIEVQPSMGDVGPETQETWHCAHCQLAAERDAARAEVERLTALHTKDEEVAEILREEIERMDEAIAEVNEGPPAYRITIRNQRNELAALNKAYDRVTTERDAIRQQLTAASQELDYIKERAQSRINGLKEQRKKAEAERDALQACINAGVPVYYKPENPSQFYAMCGEQQYIGATHTALLIDARLIDHLRDNAGDALDLFRDNTNDTMSEVDLIAALLHHIDERGGDVAKSHATALGMYQSQKIENALIELGGTKQ